MAVVSSCGASDEDSFTEACNWCGAEHEQLRTDVPACWRLQSWRNGTRSAERNAGGIETTGSLHMDSEVTAALSDLAPWRSLATPVAAGHPLSSGTMRPDPRLPVRYVCKHPLKKHRARAMGGLSVECLRYGLFLSLWSLVRRLALSWLVKPDWQAPTSQDVVAVTLHSSLLHQTPSHCYSSFICVCSLLEILDYPWCLFCNNPQQASESI